MEDIPTRKSAAGTGIGDTTTHASTTATSGSVTGRTSPQPSSPSSTRQPDQPPHHHHHERIKEVGAIRYVRELTTYLRELERTGRSNVADIVATRESQTKQIDDLIKSQSKVKSLEDNNTYLREKLIETQKKLALYMNQMHGGGGGSGSGGLGLGGGPSETSGKQNNRRLPVGDNTAEPIATEGATTNQKSSVPLGSFLASPDKTQQGKGKPTSAGLPPITYTTSSVGGPQTAFSPYRSTAGGVGPSPTMTNAVGSPGQLNASSSTTPALSLASLKDILHEAQLSVQSLKTQALLSSPPNASASVYSALHGTMSVGGGGFGGGSSVKRPKGQAVRRAQTSMK